MKKLLTNFFAVFALIALTAAQAWAQFPGAGQIPIDPYSVPQFVDPVPHFAGMRVDGTKGGDLIIKEVMTQQVALSTGTVSTMVPLV